MTIEEKFMLPLKYDIKQVLRIDAEAIPSFSPVMTKLLALSIDEAKETGRNRVAAF